MYYTHYIKDTNYSQLLKGQTKNNNGDNLGKVYSVFRNSIYNLKINSLKQIGTDIPGGWSPYLDANTPIENDNLYMKVTVEVNPWVLSDQDIDLG